LWNHGELFPVGKRNGAAGENNKTGEEEGYKPQVFHGICFLVN